MSPRAVARTVAVRATVTVARRNVVETTVPAVAVATPGKGHSQARAVANANLSSPLRIWVLETRICQRSRMRSM
jgi:hypothetical protein